MNIWAGQVGFGGFGILWPEPNLTCCKIKICNPTQPTKPKKSTQPGGLGWVRSVLMGRQVGCTPLIKSSTKWIHEHFNMIMWKWISCLACMLLTSKVCHLLHNTFVTFMLKFLITYIQLQQEDCMEWHPKSDHFTDSWKVCT